MPRIVAVRRLRRHPPFVRSSTGIVGCDGSSRGHPSDVLPGRLDQLDP
jgi:hypothetical protein